MQMQTIENDTSELSRRLRWRQLEISTIEKSGNKSHVASNKNEAMYAGECAQRALRDLTIQLNQTGKMNSHYHLLRIESFREDFKCVHRHQLLKVCDQYVTFPNSPRVKSVSEEQSR